MHRRVLVGRKFGGWTVLEWDAEKSSHAVCQCSCGAIHSVSVHNIQSGVSSHCRKCASRIGHRNRRERIKEREQWRRSFRSRYERRLGSVTRGKLYRTSIKFITADLKKAIKAIETYDTPKAIKLISRTYTKLKKKMV